MTPLAASKMLAAAPGCDCAFLLASAAPGSPKYATVLMKHTTSLRPVTEWPQHLNAYQFFLGDRLEEGAGDRPALRLDEGVVSYIEVDRLTAGYVSALADAGVDRGDRVLIVLSDGPGFVAALFATMR